VSKLSLTRRYRRTLGTIFRETLIAKKHAPDSFRKILPRGRCAFGIAERGCGRKTALLAFDGLLKIATEVNVKKRHLN